MEYSHVSSSEKYEISEFLKSKEMLHNLSFLLQKEVGEEEVTVNSCYLANKFFFPTDFNDDWDAKISNKDIYSDSWVYIIPIMIKDERTIIMLKKDDEKYEFAEISYGDENIRFFIDDTEIEDTVIKAGIFEEEINYSDVLFSPFLHTVFIHINTDKKDYLIPYTAIDMSEYYEKKLYKSGEIYETKELLQMIVDASLVDLSKKTEEKDEPQFFGGESSTADNNTISQVELFENSHENSYLNSDKAENINNRKTVGEAVINPLAISGCLMTVCLILVILGVKSYKKHI